MTDHPRRLLPPPANRIQYWVAAVAAFLMVLAVLLMLPRGRSVAAPIVGPKVRVDLTEDVVLSLAPELYDQGWRAELTARPYALDIRATVANAGAEAFPRHIDIEVREQPETDRTADLSTRWFGGLQTMRVPAGAEVSSDFGYTYHSPCGEFLAVVHFWPQGDGGEDQTVEVPFSVGDAECLRG